MVETAFTYIAESVVKAVGVAGVEAMAMHKAIMMVWSPLATAFSDELLGAVITEEGHVRPERAELIMARHKIKLSHDFVEEVAPYIEEFVGYAYDRGKEYILSNATSGILELQKVAKQTDAVIESLVSITGSTKANVQRTIKRWFKQTQGQYFDRFIVPETSRLMSYAGEAEGNIATLRSIGENYKKFVEANAYWSSVSEFNAESSKIWSQVQTLHELNVDTYTIVAIIDKKTCGVCLHLNGTTWDVKKAVEKVYTMLIQESEEAYEQNPFPPRSTPTDYPDPQEAPYDLPPFHPRCRCSIRSTHAISTMPQDVIARPFNTEKPPSNKLLSGAFNNYVERAVEGDMRIASGRVLTTAEFKAVKEAYNDIPYELRKWASRNKTHYKIYAVEGDRISQVIGSKIEINSKYLKSGPEVIEHELRHALMNREVITARGGAEALWNTLQEEEFRLPIHVNEMFMANGGRGLVAMRSGVDEFLALIGDYYSEGMSFDDLVKMVRSKQFGIEIAKVAGQITSKGSVLWTAKEAKKAVELWWYLMDVDNLTLMTNKQMLAKLSYLPMNAAKMHIATTNELRLRDFLRGAGIKKVFQEGDRKPFDVWIGADPAAYYSGRSVAKPKHVIEVKSIIQAKNDKITMHKESLLKKKLELKKWGKKTTEHTVVFDERTGKIYYKQGLGSFRLGSMQEVTEGDLQVLFGGKEQVSQVVGEIPRTVTYREITTAKAFKEFRRNMELVKTEHRAFLDWYSWQEYKAKGIRVFMDKDGYTGFGLTKDNTLVTLWCRADAPKGIGGRSIAEAIRRGCTNLECFDGKLPKIYGQFGFKEVARYPWNPEYAPKGWLVDKFGKPDYLEMRLTTAEARTTAPYRLTLPPSYTSYDDAAKAALAYMEEVNPEFLDIVKRYTGLRGEFWDWNDILRNSPDLGVALSNKKYGEAITLLHEALTNSPNYKGIVWRGMNLHGEEGRLFYAKVVDALENDKALQFKGFTSSSTSWESAHKFAVSRDVDYQVLIKIESDRGVAISSISGSPKEKEVLFDAFTSFRVKNFVKTTDDWGNEIWELTLVEEPKYGVTTAAQSTERLSAIRSATKTRVVDEGTLREKGSISNGNVNEVRIVTIGTGNKKYIFKPVSGESYYMRGLKWELDQMGVSSINEVTDGMASAAGYSDVDNMLRNFLMRSTIDNTDIPLAVRESFALDVAERLGFNNEFAIVPKHMLVKDTDGNIVGVLIEHISKTFDGGMWKDFSNARGLGPEESFQMAVFDYLIGNTDRHHNNWMRKYTRLEKTGATAFEGSTPRVKTLIEKNPVGDGRPVYIDHGYSMPSQSMDLGGLAEFRAQEAAERWVSMQMEYDFNQEWYDDFIRSIQKFMDEDAEDLAKAYGFSYEETDAFLRRGDSLLERLRGGTFSELLVQHEDNGLWGLQDDFIE